MQRESLTEWADLHGETITTTPAPVEHCDRHGAWTYTHAVDECPACSAAYDALARADADSEPAENKPTRNDDKGDTWPS